MEMSVWESRLKPSKLKGLKQLHAISYGVYCISYQRFETLSEIAPVVVMILGYRTIFGTKTMWSSERGEM